MCYDDREHPYHGTRTGSARPSCRQYRATEPLQLQPRRELLLWDVLRLRLELLVSLPQLTVCRS